MEYIIDLIMFVVKIIIKTIYFIMWICFYLFPEILILIGGLILFGMIKNYAAIGEFTGQYGIMLVTSLLMMTLGIILEIWFTKKAQNRLSIRIKKIFGKIL